MSAVIQQEDVANSGKDDENKEITSDNTGNTSVGDDASNADFDNKLNPSVLKTIDLPSVNAAGDIEKPLSHEKSPVDKSEGIPKEIDKCVGHSELSSISLSKAFDSHNMQKDTEFASKDTLDNIPSVSNITNPQVDDNLHVAEPGYKETAIDDASDSEIELRWSDDEYDDEINATPLSNEALKSLDIELGIADTDSIENSKKDIPEGAVISTVQSLIEVEKPNESVDDKNLDILTLPQNSMEIEYSKELVDGTDKKVSTIVQNPTKIVNPLVAVNNDPESVKIKSDAVNLDEELSIDNSGKAGKTNIEPNIETKQTQHDDTKSQPVESGLESTDTKRKVESKLESANAIANESEKLMDIDIPTAESVSESVESNEKFTHLVKEMDEEDKISEIDIDETIVDLKQLIDQDEDTIKQLGLDVQKSNDKSDTKHKTEQSSKAIEEAKLMEVESEKVKDEIDDTLKDTKSVKNEDSQLIDENIAHEIRHIATVTETKTSLDTNLVEIPNIQEEKITESTSMDAEESEIITSNVENKHSNDTLENTPKIITDDIDFKSGVTTSKESSTRYIEETDNTKDILQMPDDISDIQHAVDSKIAIEEYENDKEKNSTAQLEKDSQNQNNSPADTPTDQKILENYDNVENNLITPIEKDIDMNEDHCKTSNETNLDECESVSKDGLKPDTEEFITPDITNDSIKINTDHRINRPDVMLDIPTQELDFEDFDDTDDQPVNTNENDSDLTTKTVTEIVNQLAKDTDKNTDENKTNNLKTAETMDREMKEINDVTTPDEKKTDETTTSDINMTSTDNIPKTNKLEGATNSDSKAEETLTSENDKSLEKDVKSKENSNKPETIPQDDEKDLKSTENSETSENLNIQASKSTEDTKDVTNKIPITQEDKSSEVVSKLTEKPEIADPQPSTSEGITEEPQEVTDSLGLLAESSRVMDEDDDEEQEPEDDEADDGEGDVEDDDDFDPDEEESSNQTGEHSEESNPPHSEVDIHEEGIDIEFNNEADKIGLDSNDTNFDALLGDSTDIMDEVNEALNAAKKTCEETRESQQEPGSKSVESTEKISEPTTKGNKTRERRSSILAELLTKPAADMNIVKAEDIQKQDKSKKKTDSKTVKDIVDLGGSSDDDVSISKDSKQEAPSVIQKAELDRDEKDTTAKIVTESIDDFNDESMEPKVQMDDTEKSKTGEVFSLDSDDDDKDKKEVSFIGAPRENNKCINYNCTSDDSIAYYLADRMTIAYYGAARRRKRAVCQNCLDVVNARNEGLVSGIKDLRPLMSLRMARPTQTLLEISDSDSEGEDEPVGEDGARLLEDQLTDMLNEVWTKYNMDDRLKVTETYLEAELEKMQKDSEEVDKLLRDCQKATDELRVAFYSSFEGPRKELPSISIHDTPIASYACLETEEEIQEGSQLPLRYSKRRSTSAIETPAKKIALPFDDRKMTRSSSMAADQKPDEDKDISVVHLSAEAAPADLPPPGELVKPPLRVGLQVFAMKNQYGAWLRGKVLEIQPKANEAQFTICRVRFEHKVKNPCKALSARSIAYTEPCEVRMSIGTRVIALFKNSENTNKRGEFYYSGVIAEIPNPVNGYRYLVFFDDGYAQYVDHKHTRLVCESKPLVWEEVHPFSRDFVCNYLSKYPERPMVRVHPGQEVNVEWNGKWWDTKVIKVDAALVHVQFPDNRTEWIYRGSTRLKPLFAELLAAKRGDRARLPRSTKANTKTNMPYVEYTRSDDQVKADTQSAEDLRRQRSVAKKSTTIAQQISNAATDGVISRVVFYTPKNSVRPLSMAPHACGPQCRRSDLLSLKDLRTYNPLTKPLLSGWERQIVKHKASRLVMYRAPCGRRLRSVRELHRYLRAVRSDMPVDLFDYNPNTHCLAEFVLNKTNVQKKDLSHGKENVPVPCVNYYDHSLPEFCSYNTVRTPTAGVPLNLDPEFLCGCDCDDDCEDKTKCACWKMTLEGAKTIGLDGMGVGYNYRRLPEPLPSGIYECNSRCKCKSTCLNRVVQNPLQLKLQVFKTLNRGWGIRALNDVPKGAFICIYAGNLLTDATANLDGLNEGDEYLAELDYIEVVEAMKEGYEEDIPEADKILDKKESKKSESEPETDSTESEEEKQDATDKLDGDFQPGYLGYGISKFNKRLRRRDKKKNKEDNAEEQTIEEKKTEEGEDCITISDDEEVRVSQREPSRFAAQESMTDNKVVSKYRSIRSHFGKDEACYIMDAKVQGNIGRYLNHSCSPNVFVQNVFVDTHDPRFPWVSFFALHHIRAGTELTWNYNYDIGSVPGKVLYCYCGAPNCRRRLL